MSADVAYRVGLCPIEKLSCSLKKKMTCLVSQPAKLSKPIFTVLFQEAEGQYPESTAVACHDGGVVRGPQGETIRPAM